MKRKYICFVIHYFDSEGDFVGKSKTQHPSVRKEVVQNCLSSLRENPDLEVVTCGLSGKGLVPIDFNLDSLTQEPQHLVYEILSYVKKMKEDYDYYMVIEDDIAVNSNMIEAVALFDSTGKPFEIYHPNRIEIKNGKTICIDTSVIPGRTGKKIRFQGRMLYEYVNPHSGLMIVNQEKRQIIQEAVDESFRGKTCGGFMASAFAHYHRPFTLYREDEFNSTHNVYHLDSLNCSFRLRNRFKHRGLRVIEKLNLYPGRILANWAAGRDVF